MTNLFYVKPALDKNMLNGLLMGNQRRIGVVKGSESIEDIRDTKKTQSDKVRGIIAGLDKGIDTSY